MHSAESPWIPGAIKRLKDYIYCIAAVDHDAATLEALSINFSLIIDLLCLLIGIVMASELQLNFGFTELKMP